MSAIIMTAWPNLRTPVGKRVHTSWPALCARMAKPIATNDKMGLPGFALASFRDNRRAKANVDRVFALAFDFDHLAVSVEELADHFRHQAAIVHTTHSHTCDASRARAFVLLSRHVDATEYEALWAHCAGVIESAGHVVDQAAKDASRLWFAPAATPGSGVRGYRCFVNDRAPLLVDTTLEGIANTGVTTVTTPVEGLAASRDSFTTNVKLSAEQRGATDLDVVERARRYLAKCDPAISGSGGHAQCFRVAQKLVRGFGLDDATAFALMSADYNHRCRPPWSQRELIHKIRQAADVGEMPEGALRDAPRRTA